MDQTATRALAAVVAPSVNDYKRLSVGEFLTGVTSGFTWTPAFISYGDNNRTQMFRVPEPGRFECRLVSGSVNAYLGMAAFSAAGLDGIHRKLDPGEPTAGRNMYTVTLDEVKRHGLDLIPQSLPEALDAFEADAVIQAALGPELAAEFVQVKRQEWVKYHNTISQWEIHRYLTLFSLRAVARGALAESVHLYGHLPLHCVDLGGDPVGTAQTRPGFHSASAGPRRPGPPRLASDFRKLSSVRSATPAPSHLIRLTSTLAPPMLRANRNSRRANSSHPKGSAHAP